MTKITIFKKNNNIIGFRVEGHSGYSDQGSDIVCSAISTTSQMVIVGLNEVLNLKINYLVDEDKALLKCILSKDIVNKDLLKAQCFFVTFEKVITEIEKQYKRYVKLEVKDEIF